MKVSTVDHLLGQQWHQISIAATVEDLATDLTLGLSSTDVSQRQDHYGFNELKAKTQKNPMIRFLKEFNQPLIYILLMAGAISVLLKDWVDGGVIFAVTLINAVIGFLQESKAENALAALAQTVITEATVIREGQKIRLNSRELVPGDLVLMTSGDKVPADLRLVRVRNLQLSEAALTGESLPVEKITEILPADTILAERRNMAYAGSLVTFGQGKGVVVAIAEQTETGRISQLMQQNPHLETPLTRKMAKFSKNLLYIILGLAALMLVVFIGQGKPWDEGFTAAVALAVSAIPEGLPAVVTVTLAIGVNRMAQQHAIIRQLPAVETLGSTTVICSDKTGTLTENQMTVQAIYAGGSSYTVTGVGYEGKGAILANQSPVEMNTALRDCLQCGLLCNDSQIQSQEGHLSVTGDPTEGALIVVAQKAGLTLETLEPDYFRLDTIPFESQFQYMATLHQPKNSDQNKIIYVKGSLEAILKGCQEQWSSNGEKVPLNLDHIEKNAHKMAAQGLRVLAFAKKEIPPQQQEIDHRDLHSDLIFLGLQGMIDPPRLEAIAAVATCHRAGITVKMITGDHALTAKAIAEKMKLSKNSADRVFTGQELAEMSDQDLSNAVTVSDIFARVAPEQKLRLVKALQEKGEIVAMTGDGVNDAPALKQADIGIAMGITGTEVAKEAADMILTDDNFASIKAAVEEGRTVFNNLLKTISFILPVNGGEGMSIFVGTLVTSTLPILPVQILWVNMVSSVALSATLAFEPKSQKTMLQLPRRPQEPLLSSQLLWRILIISIFNLIAVFGVFEWALKTTGNLNLARTMAVNTLVSAETFYLLTISQFIPSLLTYCFRMSSPHFSPNVAYVPGIGVLCVLLLQLFFSQWDVINPLFSTYPLSFSQVLICICSGFPVIIPALLLKRFASLV